MGLFGKAKEKIINEIKYSRAAHKQINKKAKAAYYKALETESIKRSQRRAQERINPSRQKRIAARNTQLFSGKIVEPQRHEWSIGDKEKKEWRVGR